MPHDAFGHLLSVGDEVVIRGTVKWVGPVEGDKYCNVTVELAYPMPAYPDVRPEIASLNAAQVEKVEKKNV